MDLTYALGVLVSLAVQGMKKFGQASPLGTYIALAGISILAGAGYIYFTHQSYWPVLVQVIVSASAFHNLVLRKFES